MKKADWICQRCKKAKATQAHHLKYPQWGTFDVVENLLPVVGLVIVRYIIRRNNDDEYGCT